MRRLALALSAAMALACAGGGWDSGDSGASADQCANAVPLGTTVQGVDVGWHWDNSIEGYRSDTVALDVPADMFSLAVTMDAGNTDVAWSLVATPTTDWVRIERDDWGGPPFKPSLGAAATLVLPNAENTWPEAGCLRVQAVSVDEIGTSTLWFGGRTQEANTIDINAYIVGDTVVYEDELIAAFTVMFDLYIEGNGPAIGNINLYEVPANAIVSPGGEDMKELMKWTEGTGDPRALDLFFIADFTESGILGIASGLPGAILVDGTAGSGVVIAVDSHLDGSGQVVDTDLMGETMAHEVGHQLGLFHLTESQGDDFDPIADTPECPANQDDNNDGIVDADECMALGGDNFMFWGAGDVRQTDVSSTQSDVLYFSPVVK